MIAFFVRGYNDTDHIAPVVWRMHRDGHTVAVFCLEPDFDLFGDYRIRFLQAEGVPVAHAWDDADLLLGLPSRALWRIVNASFTLARRFSAQGNAILTRLARAIGYRWFRRLRASVATADIDRFLRVRGISLLCFDWVSPSRSIVGPLLAGAARAGLKSVALPHGAFLCTNDDIAHAADPARTIGWRNAIADPFDHVVVQMRGFTRFLRDGDANAAKVLVLGSARFCSEWAARNIAIAPRVLPASAYDDPRLKCAFIVTRLHYNVDDEAQRAAFTRMAAIPEARVVIKPHTRSSLEAQQYAGLALEDASDVSSVELCQWADVVLVIASSVVIEALQQHKVVLYLKYLHTNQTLHEEYGDCWVIESEDELADALQRLARDRTDVPYARADAERFLVDVVEGGVPGRDVLGDHSRALAGLAVR
ncbi:MAG: hypothetical protein O3C09_01720 [Proteobacteria bacterium]|nr:hypothetical protein [Pseudomonadota bacterium]